MQSSECLFHQGPKARQSRVHFARGGSHSPLFRVLAGVLLVLLLAFPVVSAEPFTFVQIADPQFGLGGYKRDIIRFEETVKQVNKLEPDFVVICGDLVNTSSIGNTLEHFAKEKSAFAMPCYCVPGNHDVGSGSAELLAQYRRVIGPDYYEFEHKGHVFLMVNSQLWMEQVPGETEKQEEWFKSSLEKAFAAHKPVFVVAHHPLYNKSPQEPTDVWSIPIEKRRELLALIERYGVVAWLAGHVHKNVENEYKGVQFVSTVNPTFGFFEQAFGFRVWHIGNERPYRQEFVTLDISGLDPGKEVTGSVSGLHPGEDCFLVILSGSHKPEHWTVDSVLALEQQSWVREPVKGGKFAVTGIPAETITVIAAALTGKPNGLDARFESVVLTPDEVGLKPLSFVFTDKSQTSEAGAK